MNKLDFDIQKIADLPGYGAAAAYIRKHIDSQWGNTQLQEAEYRVKLFFSGYHTIIVCANNPEEAKDAAYEKFDLSQATDLDIEFDVILNL